MKRTILLILALIGLLACSKVSSSSTSDTNPTSATNSEDVFFVRYIRKSAPMVTYTNEKRGGKYHLRIRLPKTEYLIEP